jgi:hypothetical protein
MNHNETLRILNTVYRTTLAPIVPSVTTSPSITTPLYPHQFTLLQGMLRYRKQMTQGLQFDDHTLTSKIGIVGDPSGSGKTLAVLGYLASDTEYYATTELSPYSSPYFYSQKVTYSQNTTNLIIVPSHLFGHWQDEIKKHTTIAYTPIETRGKLKNDMVQTILSSTFVLTTNKCYKYVQEYATRHQITWNNIVIDEPLFIQMKTSDPKLNFQFLWLITYQWPSLIFRNSIKKSQVLFLREPMHPDLEEMLLDNITDDIHIFPSQFMKQYVEYNHSHRGYLILRNYNYHVRSSCPVIHPQYSIVQCKSTTTLQALSSIYLSRNTQITSIAVPHLFQALSIDVQTKDNYCEQYSEKSEMIRRKVEENECGICLEPCVYPTMVTCCHHVYCGKCILQNTIIQYKCPTCRETLDVSRIRCLSEIGINVLHTKKEACMNIIRAYPSCIIHISFDKIYYDLLHELRESRITCELVTAVSLRKAVKSFKEGTVKVLFISKIELIRGLSLPASCLLFYHEQIVFEQRQALLNMVSTTGVQVIHLHSEVQV